MENRSSLQYISEFYSGAQKTSQPVKSSGGFRPREPKPKPKMGAMCPACGLMRSLSGLCDCNTF
ncbi:hypothetical protein SEA_NICEHOUSE_35 [Rhodococcus phage NiceHouse]|nr:hypothetical protein SEA_NICEHOUSE_35 [Rhodococcus phage NiceHouse]